MSLSTARSGLPTEHGGRNALREGSRVESDFSVCLNAFGTAPVVRDAIRQARIDEYPDPEWRAARHVAAREWAIPIERIALGAGAAELIDATCRAFVRAGDRVVIDAPAFGEYRRAALLCGAVVRDVYQQPDTWSYDAICDVVRRDMPALVFVASLSSPFGIARDLRELSAIADCCAEVDSILVLDQAYDAFAERPLGVSLASHPAVLLLRSLTKEHALAGVRVAFAIGLPQVIRAIEAVRVPWAASALAEVAAVATFTPEAKHHVARTVALLRTEAKRVGSCLDSVGYEIAPSSTHYFCIPVASALRARHLLLDRARMLVRDCSSFGLPSHIRVAARTLAENDRLIDALDRLSSLIRS
ncbi:MAG TPA: histidinol-phosphate transaminase [Gemmatimonadaceae bacterium]|nr:histidinol-phosphate transaminase [Gemmatimonadaceae bacterium]